MVTAKRKPKIKLLAVAERHACRVECSKAPHSGVITGLRSEFDDLTSPA